MSRQYDDQISREIWRHDGAQGFGSWAGGDLGSRSKVGEMTLDFGSRPGSCRKSEIVTSSQVCSSRARRSVGGQRLDFDFVVLQSISSWCSLSESACFLTLDSTCTDTCHTKILSIRLHGNGGTNVGTPNGSTSAIRGQWQVHSITSWLSDSLPVCVWSVTRVD